MRADTGWMNDKKCRHVKQVSPTPCVGPQLWSYREDLEMSVNDGVMHTRMLPRTASPPSDCLGLPLCLGLPHP
eukprot:12140486-Karenia_brevis.AAC.1